MHAGIVLALIAVVRVSSGFQLTVLHVNDIHVRFEETNKYSSACKPENRGDCYGGVARLQYAVNDVKSKEDNVIFLNAGDFYQGNIWYTFFKWRVVAHFSNILNFTAMVIGNHEFDDGVSGFVPFLKNVSFPVIGANIDTSEEKSMQGLFSPSTVTEVGGRKIGIIGYITQETDEISNSRTLGFTDEVEAVKKEARRLKSQGVDILIGLGHAGYEVDQVVAREVPEIDLVVGGHSHTFLYTGDPPSVEEADGEYPTLITQPSGRVVPVIQAYAFTKYLGHFRMNFSDDGEMRSWSGRPILLNNDVPEDEEVLQELQPWKHEIESIGQKIIGHTNVLLLEARNRETNIGNLITDSMVYHYTSNPPPGSWTRAALAFINSGGIRSSYEVGNITVEDMITVSPFQNTIDLLSIKGKHLRDTFELVVEEWLPSGESRHRRLLQVSGFRIIYDLRRAPGNRLVEILVRCSRCEVPTYSPLVDEEVYDVITLNYVANGGDGYYTISENKLTHVTGPLDTDAFQAYISTRGRIVSDIEGRVTIRTSKDGPIEEPCTDTAVTAEGVLSRTVLLVLTLLHFFYAAK